MSKLFFGIGWVLFQLGASAYGLDSEFQPHYCSPVVGALSTYGIIDMCIGKRTGSDDVFVRFEHRFSSTPEILKLVSDKIISNESPVGTFKHLWTLETDYADIEVITRVPTPQLLWIKSVEFRDRQSYLVANKFTCVGCNVAAQYAMPR